ncbi:MAG: hypothetical protein JHC19_00130 [Desulfurococcaceae archaeon]|nr:hypothetical protein [Desulfurococcaceae archaeon]
MRKGFSTPAVAFLLSLTIIFLSIYTFYEFLNVTSLTYNMIKENMREKNECEHIKILNLSSGSYNMIEIMLINEGSSALKDIKDLKIIIVSYVNNKPYTYLLHQCENTDISCWSIKKIVAGEKVFSYDTHGYLMPGEILYLDIYLPIDLSRIDYGYISVISPCSKAVRVLVFS